MKKILLAVMILTASCTKTAVSDTSSNETLFISGEIATAFTVPQVGFRVSYKVQNCKSAVWEYNTNDGKGWKQRIVPINAQVGDLIFLYYFRYRFNITKNDGSNWISSERVCKY